MIKEQLLNDYKESIKTKDTNKKNVVTMIRAAILQVEKDTQTELTDEQIVEVIAKQVKQRKDSIEEFQKGNRQDLIEACQAEIDYLMQFLPKQLTDEELTAIIKEEIASLGIESPKQMGVLMKSVIAKVKGSADGKKISSIASALLK